ncbi:hypothetical protein [Portibacter lacus]|uniref:hypothetical protein n=1 Tax=Portibacter lacus TaxID=1099794 RepID=UPI001F1E7670|nr:hypothetical protein [Portibacter lacus]
MPLILFISAMLTKDPGVVGVITILAFLGCCITYFGIISLPFIRLKTKLREVLLDTFMKTYHPTIEYQYFEGKKNVKEIIRSSKLISVNIFKEEDVIQGNMDGAQFYLSEIHLKKKSGKTERTVFKGMLFRIRIPGKNYPESKIQSNPEFMRKILGGLEKNEEHNFYYESDDLATIEKHIGSLFPFIKHLIQKNNDVRIKIKGDELVLLLESDIKFLDDPKPRLDKSFDNQEYYNKLAKHLNTFMFIIESLASGADALELEEKMKVKLENYKSVIKLRQEKE